MEQQDKKDKINGCCEMLSIKQSPVCSTGKRGKQESFPVMPQSSAGPSYCLSTLYATLDNIKCVLSK